VLVVVGQNRAPSSCHRRQPSLTPTGLVNAGLTGSYLGSSTRLQRKPLGPATGAHVTDRSAGSTSKPIDLAAVALCRAASPTVTHGEQRAKGVVPRWRRTVIVKALAGDRSTDPLRDQYGDVYDPLALVDACLHVVAHSDR
jgi:hypothetical protein